MTQDQDTNSAAPSPRPDSSALVTIGPYRLSAGCARANDYPLGVLDRIDGRYGLATLCVGVGQGVATIVERLEN